MPRKPTRDLPPVVVGGSYMTGVVLMRDLVRRGVKACCIDCISTDSGFRTVYGKAHLCPNPDTDPLGWERFMIELAGTFASKPVFIPSADQFVTAIADHAEVLKAYYIFNEASSATQALLATKKRQYEVAGDNGLPVPRTAFVESVEEVRRFAAAAHFPCLLKPLHFREWEVLPAGHPLRDEKIAPAASPAELESQYRLAEAASPAVVVQEIIEGPDTAKLVYLCCYGRGGRRLGSCIVRELRTTPIYFGSASVVEPIDDPETDALCDNFFRSIGYEGICELELKRDSRDGKVKLIEANPRFSVTADAASYAGVDLGWAHYLDLIGEPFQPVSWNGRHFHHIALSRDVRCFRDYMKAGLLTWGGLIRTYRSAAYFDFDPRDWRVASETSIDVLRALLHPVYRRLFPKHG